MTLQRLGCVRAFPFTTAPYPSREKGAFQSWGRAGKAGRASCPSQLAGQGIPFPSLDQQRALEACKRGDSAKENERGGRNTKSAQLDRVNSHPAKATESKAQVSCSLGAGGSSCRSSCSEFWPWSQEYNRKTVVLGVFNLPFPERSGQIGLAYAGVGGKAISAEEEEMPSCRQSQALNELNYGRRSG